MESQNVIYFYDVFDETRKSKPEDRYLNNFEISPFVSSTGENFLSVEHYYQAHKFGDFSKEGFKNIYEEIKKAESPDLCKKIARQNEKAIGETQMNKAVWDEKLKEYYMKRALVYKFSQHKDLLSKLIKTDNAKLIEESFKDKYWGGVIEGSLNRLGGMLMELRDNYKNTKTVYLNGSNLQPINIDI